MYQSFPKPPIPPGIPRGFAPYSGEFDKSEAHPVGHLTFVSKRWSASQAKRFCYCFRIQHDCAPRSRPGHSSYIHCFVGAFCEPFEKPVKCELSGMNNFIEKNKPSYDSFRRLKIIRLSLVGSLHLNNRFMNGI